MGVYQNGVLQTFLEGDRTSLDSTLALANTIDGNVDTTLLEVTEIEEHIHTVERWAGLLVPQVGSTAWADFDTSDPYVLTSGDDTWGADVQVLGTEDTPVVDGNTKFDLHTIIPDAPSAAGVYKVQICWGEATAGDARTAEAFTETVFVAGGVGANVTAETQAIKFPKISAGNRVWARVWHATDGATLSMFVELHEYVA